MILIPKRKLSEIQKQRKKELARIYLINGLIILISILLIIMESNLFIIFAPITICFVITIILIASSKYKTNLKRLVIENISFNDYNIKEIDKKVATLDLKSSIFYNSDSIYISDSYLLEYSNYHVYIYNMSLSRKSGDSSHTTLKGTLIRYQSNYENTNSFIKYNAYSVRNYKSNKLSASKYIFTKQNMIPSDYEKLYDNLLKAVKCDKGALYLGKTVEILLCKTPLKLGFKKVDENLYKYVYEYYTSQIESIIKAIDFIDSSY